jgi:hypothetical protein
MDHKEAERTSAVEKYLLNEFTTDERLEFEAHFFDCPICTDSVRQSAISIDNIRSVLREHSASSTLPKRTPNVKFKWLSGLRVPVLVPSLAALILAAVVSYQNSVLIPRFERPLVLSTNVLSSVSRGTAPVVRINRNRPLFNLNFEVDSPRVLSSYECDFQNEKKDTVLSVNSGPKKVANFTLDLLLPTKQFPPGSYAMVLRPTSDPKIPLQQYDFVIQYEVESQ